MRLDFLDYTEQDVGALSDNHWWNTAFEHLSKNTVVFELRYVFIISQKSICHHSYGVCYIENSLCGNG